MGVVMVLRILVRGEQVTLVAIVRRSREQPGTRPAVLTPVARAIEEARNRRRVDLGIRDMVL